MKNFINSVRRFINGLKRPSKKTNTKRLYERGETPDSFTFRDATEADIPELGKLHAITWAQTYTLGKSPNIQLRQYQWQKAFTEENDGSWFCILVVDKTNKLVGFAKGKTYRDNENSELRGDLNKIYLLSEYQRLGLGTKLIGLVARRFLSKGVNDMVLFGIPQNPSCAFHEAMGGERLYSEKGTFDGGYRWTDLKKLAELCPVN
ncbi:MAG TPA: GNAT family N-acetyltransferase [Chitinophagaceae bacterium]|jgi:L-amino acid N-acyltransferase YncA|nr:GNAT family N-acetyltransferase [Chitinophagaceae bacterium]